MIIITFILISIIMLLSISPISYSQPSFPSGLIELSIIFIIIVTISSSWCLWVSLLNKLNTRKMFLYCLKFRKKLINNITATYFSCNNYNFSCD